MKPLISIIIANYNYGRFLETAIQSVLRQCRVHGPFTERTSLFLPTGHLIELIIVDGGSTDNSVEVITKYENVLAWWCSEKDRGQSHAFNKGFARAKGKFLTWLNADDIFIADGLSAVARKMVRHPKHEWFIGSCIWFDERLAVERCFRAHRFSRMRARWSGHLSVGGPSSFFSKRLLNCTGGVDESLHYTMDIDLWFKFYFQESATYLRVTDYVWGYRIHGASKMSGPVVAPDTNQSIEHRQKFRVEAERLRARYGRSRWVARLVTWMSVAPIDHVISRLATLKHRGRTWGQPEPSAPSS